MKNFYNYLVAIFLIGVITVPLHKVNAGNKDRAGQAGAGELLINPWAGSSGWGGVNVANTTGLESIYNNVAGIAFTSSTELIFANTNWMNGADINLMSFGLSQRVGDAGVIGFSIMSMNFGEIQIRTVDQPEGGIGTFSPRYMNINIAYAKAFSNAIYGGINFKIITESIADAKAQGLGIDAGIQYVAGDMENIKFGISLRNVGPTMKYSGDGYSLSTIIPGQNDEFTTTQRGMAFDLPTQLNIGFAYDFLFDKSRFTLAGNFASNSFTKDQIMLGGEYSFRNILVLRAGYNYEEGIMNDVSDPERTNANRGVSAGFSVQIPMNKEKGSIFGIDYAYRPTDNFATTHSIGIKITL